MSSASPTKDGNDQTLFLLSCIKHAENGRPDFGKIADELGIVSKGAAAKRYERLLKAHNIPLPSQRAKAGGSEPATPIPTPKKRGAKALAADDGEDETSPKNRVRKAAVKKTVVKGEEPEEHDEGGGERGDAGEGAIIGSVKAKDGEAE